MINFKPVKVSQSTGIIFFFILAVFIITCEKDEVTEKQLKEALTIKLNSEISSDSLKSYVTWLQNMGTRFALSEKHRNVALKIKNRFTSYGFSDCRLDSFTISTTYRNIKYQQWQYNVIATLEGSAKSDSVCIIGGHYDDILQSGDPFSEIYGANDNASGVAATLEIARVMKKNNYSPAGKIEFIAFGSEELGMLGSYAYASDAKQKSKKIKLMLNNDMIAYQPGNNQAEWIVNILDYDNSHELRTEAEQLSSRFTVLKYKNDNTYSKASDSYPFFVNGYKAVFFFSNSTDPYYHTLNDKVGNFNFEYCCEIARLGCSLLVDKN